LPNLFDCQELVYSAHFLEAFLRHCLIIGLLGVAFGRSRRRATAALIRTAELTSRQLNIVLNMFVPRLRFSGIKIAIAAGRIAYSWNLPGLACPLCSLVIALGYPALAPAIIATFAA
jgi:hypothetical protein